MLEQDRVGEVCAKNANGGAETEAPRQTISTGANLAVCALEQQAAEQAVGPAGTTSQQSTHSAAEGTREQKAQSPTASLPGGSRSLAPRTSLQSGTKQHTHRPPVW